MPQWDVKLDGYVWGLGVGGVPCTKLLRDAGNGVVLVDGDGDRLAE